MCSSAARSEGMGARFFFKKHPAELASKRRYPGQVSGRQSLEGSGRRTRRNWGRASAVTASWQQSMRTNRLQIIAVAVLILSAPGAAFLFEVRMRLRPLLMNSWQCISTGGAFFSSAQAAMAGNPAQPSLALHERQIFESSSFSSSVLGIRQTLAQVRALSPRPVCLATYGV